MAGLPGSVLFLCNHNAVRSPLAEGIAKKLFGRAMFVQSAGVRHDFETDPFMVTVAGEIGVDLSAHRPRSVAEMEGWGEDIGAYDLIVALSPAAQRLALEYTRQAALEVDYWPTLDPTGIGGTRETRLDAYRETRDQILDRLQTRFAVVPGG